MYYKVKVIPNSKKNEIVEHREDWFKIKIAAVPKKGKANKELVKFLAKKFDVPKSQVRIVVGHTSQEKVIEIDYGKK